MGQSSSCQPSETTQKSRTTSIQVDGQEVQISNYMYYESEERHCFDMLCNTGQNPAKQHNHRWRRETLSQLKNLDLAEWPQLLSKTLKRLANPKLDLRFQAELFWLDANFHKISSDNKEPLSQINFPSQYDTYLNDSSESRTSLHDEQIDAYQKAQSHHQIIQSVKSMLETSDIIDDNLLEPKSAQPWKNKLSVDEPKSAMTQSINYKSKVPDFSFYEDEENHIVKKSSSPWKKRMESSQKCTEGHKNSLLINQVPLVNGMDGRSINNMNDLYLAIKKYKAVTTLIEKHIDQEENTFYQLIHQFEDYFVKKYQETMEKIKEGQISRSECEEITSKATIDLQQFIIVAYEAMNQFYCLNNLNMGKMNGQEGLFNRNNMINFVTSLVFRRKIHEIIFTLHSFQLEDIENTYQANLRYCSTLQPQDFGVPDAYCLNEATFRLIKDKKHPENSESPLKMVETSIEAAEEEETDQKSSMSRRSNLLSSARKLTKEYKVETEYQNNPDYLPYQKAIIAMQSLRTKQSPIHKLKAIVKVAEIVSECIDDFYKKYGGSRSEDGLSGDETLAVLMYILTKSKVENVLAHCKIIEKFSTGNILSSVSGYYSVTLEACVNYISNLNVPEESCSVEQFVDILKNFMTSLNQ